MKITQIMNAIIIKMNKEYKWRSYLNGAEVYYEDGEWYYSDNSESAKETKRRECPACGKMPTKEGHDACLGTLPGVKHACCGHGVEEGYIMFENGVVIRFDNCTVEHEKKYKKT